MQKAKTGWTYVSQHSGGTPTAIAQKVATGYTQVQGH